MEENKKPIKEMVKAKPEILLKPTYWPFFMALGLTQIAVKYRQIEPHRWFQLFWMAACVLQI